MERFGTLARVFEAEPVALEEINGVGPQAAMLISLIQPLDVRFLTGTPGAKTVLRSTGDAAAYFQAKLKGLPEEQVHVAFVNAKNAVTATECLQRGTVDQSVVYVRKVIERALAHKASGFIVVHNHPSGDPTPSAHDRELTQTLKAAAATVGLRFLDHLIIGEATPFSLDGATPPLTEKTENVRRGDQQRCAGRPTLAPEIGAGFARKLIEGQRLSGV